ncbi:MAG: C1 family peptidase, partial [Syntrophomonadaceae bacterium]|nr:C1 family peptidase [Syntrophomonadaceae bacterium]
FSSESAFLSPVKDQGRYGTCVGQAAAGLKEFEENRERPYERQVSSAAYAYSECRKFMSGKDLLAPGAFPRDVMKVLREYGCVDESVMPYSMIKNDVAPLPDPVPFRALAGAQKIVSYARLYTLEDIKEAVFREGVVLTAAFVTDSFVNPKNGAFIDKAEGAVKGGHAFLIIGWNDYLDYQGTTGFFRIRNSWGEEWGEKGHAWLSYDYCFKEVSL